MAGGPEEVLDGIRRGGAGGGPEEVLDGTRRGGLAGRSEEVLDGMRRGGKGGGRRGGLAGRSEEALDGMGRGGVAGGPEVGREGILCGGVGGGEVRDRCSERDLALDRGLVGLILVGLCEVEEEVLGGEVGGEVKNWPECRSPSTDMLLNLDRSI